MAVTIVFDIKKFNKFLSIYEQSQTKFAGKKALTKFGQRIKGSQGLQQRYKRIFNNPVPFTLNSTFTMQRGLEMDVGIKDKVGKGNPAGKYLFPPIGVGSGKAYDTQFTQYLRNRNLIERSDYPYPNTDYHLVRTNKYGNVTQGTYGATKMALGKTRDTKGRTGLTKGSKIGDRRVFAVKRRGASNNKTLKAGIYRETGKSAIRALFFFGKIPVQQKGGKNPNSSMTGRLFPEIVKNFADPQLTKLWLQEIKRLAK